MPLPLTNQTKSAARRSRGLQVQSPTTEAVDDDDDTKKYKYISSTFDFDGDKFAGTSKIYSVGNHRTEYWTGKAQFGDWIGGPCFGNRCKEIHLRATGQWAGREDSDASEEYGNVRTEYGQWDVLVTRKSFR